MTDAPELKPCPFCGSDNVQAGGDDKVVGVWCHNCQASGPNGYLTINGDHDWNTRADLPPAVKPLVWEKISPTNYKAVTSIYIYEMIEKLDGEWWLYIDGKPFWLPIYNLQPGLNRANEIHRNCVLSCLVGGE